MARINPEGQVTRKERLVTVIAIIAAVLVHAVALFGWGRLYRWSQEEQKKERLMVIRRVRDSAPRETIPEPPRPRPGPAGTEGAAGGANKAAPPPPPDPKVSEPGPEPPSEAALPAAMEQELQEQKAEQQAKAPEHGDNEVSVLTDRPEASFIISGPVEFRGAGTIWIRKGAPPGTYTATFNPVAGYATPPVQTRELAAKGAIVFKGFYKRSVEVVIDSNEPGAKVTIHRPDGQTINLAGPGRLLLEDLKPGTYTAVFKDIPGHVTPAPVSVTLGPGGKLAFYGEYQESQGARGGGEEGARAGQGTGARGAGQGGGGGYGRGSGSGGGADGGGDKPWVKTAAAPKDSGLDRRVQMIVTSYPRTRIDDYHDAIPYPEVIIRKSDFQQGWCQVYLVLSVDARGEIQEVAVERPRPAERSRFEALIKSVEAAVRTWDYDRVSAEVHVDVRFYVE